MQKYSNHSPLSRGWFLTPSGMLYDHIEIGMPLTGLNNLGESPLLKHLGDLRWRHLSALCGIPSKDIVDDEGQRIYATFFYVEMGFPENRPLASFGENDQIKIASTVKRYGASMLDGICYLLPPDYPETDDLPFDDVASAVAAGIPAVRLSNVFVKMFSGTEWLKMSRPASSNFKQIVGSDTLLDSYTLLKQVQKDKRFPQNNDGYIPLTDGFVTTEYHLIPDRDLNGAGLVYFANYPVFLDVCEREVFASMKLPLSEELINRRSIVSRKSVYLNNASSRDTLIIEIEPWIKNPFPANRRPLPESAEINLRVNYRMHRKSDGRTMMVSSADKVIFGRRMESSFFASLLESE